MAQGGRAASSLSSAGCQSTSGGRRSQARTRFSVVADYASASTREAISKNVQPFSVQDTSWEVPAAVW